MAQVCGRTRKSWYLKINPVWWFMNDDEQTVDQADWYRPEWPYWRRWLYWNSFRNPLQNFRAYVAGVSDKNYWVRGREPVMAVQRNDLVPPEYGYQWCVLYGGELWVPRLFLSYSGKSVVWYVGHQPGGFWGVKFNLPQRGDHSSQHCPSYEHWYKFNERVRCQETIFPWPTISREK